MSKIVLDTSGYSRASKAQPDAVAILRQADEILMPSITLGELHYGFQFGTRTEWNLDRLTAFMSNPRVRVVNVDAVSAENYGLLSAYLRRQGIPIPTNDIWLAAITMQHGAKLLTADKHFQNMPQIVSHLLK